jgi:hypothetical protein
MRIPVEAVVGGHGVPRPSLAQGPEAHACMPYMINDGVVSLNEAKSFIASAALVACSGLHRIRSYIHRTYYSVHKVHQTSRQTTRSK